MKRPAFGCSARAHTMIDSQRLESIVSEAGRIAYDCGRGRATRWRAWEKKPGNPVSARPTLPSMPSSRANWVRCCRPRAWLSEETADDPARLGHDLIWLVDPVDGTRDFIRGAAAGRSRSRLISGGRPLIGTLCCASARMKTWQAVAGQGAFRNGHAAYRKHCDAICRIARACTCQLPKTDTDLITGREAQLDRPAHRHGRRGRAPIWSPPCDGDSNGTSLPRA